MFHGFDNFQKILAIVQKMNIIFYDNVGNSKEGSGTGFWIKTNREKYIFVTNKHNVNPLLHSKEFQSYANKKFILNFRSSSSSGISLTIDKRDISSWKVYQDEDITSPDVAIIEFGGFGSHLSQPLSLPSLPQSLLAGEEIFQLGDACHFTGFPGSPHNDSKYHLPILRTCFISSWPRIDYFDEAPEDVKTKKICLVNGLSFGGSSGSPVFTFERGIKTGEGLDGGRYTEPQLIGIMSGHWNEGEPGPSGNNMASKKSHSGLSYFTKSSAILDLIEKNKL